MIKKKYLEIDVLQAARQRIIDSFSTGKMHAFSFSGGKDSIVLGDIICNLIQEGKINPKHLIVRFIDEEAMYDEVIETVKQWRIKFISLGAKFEWYCLQVKHFNCLNTMTDEETFICWDKRKKDVWVRQPPTFAIMDDEWLIPLKDNYQAYLQRKEQCQNMVSIQGVRASESVQRLKNFARQSKDFYRISPIYDMTDKDIWLYLMIYNIDFPKVYENLYRIGTPINRLRISQFFSIDTAKALVSLGEIYPDLMERVSRREPNAYLCALYWDTEMFGRNTRKRKEIEETEEKDYRKLVFQIIREYPEDKRKLIDNIKPYIIKNPELIQEKEFKDIYEYFIAGDPKNRKKRAILMHIYRKVNQDD